MPYISAAVHSFLGVKAHPLHSDTRATVSKTHSMDGCLAGQAPNIYIAIGSQLDDLDAILQPNNPTM